MPAEHARVHGGVDPLELRALGVAPESVLDLSVNLNPYGPCPAVRDALTACAIDRYPDPTCGAARAAIAAELRVAPDTVVLGNGASELLWMLARTIAPAPATVVIAEPAFGELRAAAEACGHQVVSVRGRAEQAYACDLDQLLATVQQTRAAFAYLCNPSTPIGHAVATRALAELALLAPACCFVLDESFLSLSEQHADAALALPPNILRVRSLTKDHALPGVRIGYALAPGELVQRIERQRPSWTVSAAAQAVAQVALQQHAFLARSRVLIAADRSALDAGLRELGLSPLASCAPYVCVPVGDIGAAAQVRRRLLVRHGVLVRDCASFGLPGLVRIAVRPQRERARFLAALQKERDACRS